MNTDPFHNSGKHRGTPGLSNGRQMPGNGDGLACFDERRGAEIDVAEVGEFSDVRQQGCAQKANGDNFYVSIAVSAVYRMAHGSFHGTSVDAKTPLIPASPAVRLLFVGWRIKRMRGASHCTLVSPP